MATFLERNKYGNITGNASDEDVTAGKENAAVKAEKAKEDKEAEGRKTKGNG